VWKADPMVFDVQVEVMLREGISDPQGATIERALPALGFGGVSDIAVGKNLRFQLEADSEDAARTQVQDMCDRFLANPVIEASHISLTPASP